MKNVQENDVPNYVPESKQLLNANQQPNPLITKCGRSGKISSKSRTILWHATFWGFFINYMVRCNLNIAILSMVRPRSGSNNSATKSLECFNRSYDMQLMVNDSGRDESFNDKGRRFSVERQVMDFFKIDYNSSGFDWNEYQQGQCLGSFFWFYWATHFFGGYLANRLGTKLVFGMANFLSCVISCLIPTAAYMNFNVLLFVRMMQGILSGFCWPAMHNIISHWIPPNERSRFVSAYIGGSAGLAALYPVFGFIITFFSWEWIFHFSTLSATIWFIFWQYHVYDSPAKHPRIDPSELNYIAEVLGDSSQKKAPIPWKSILTSRPFWIVVIAFWGCIWQTFTLIIQLPTYFKFIHGFDFRISGVLAGGPHLLRMIFALFFSSFIDYLLRSKTLTRTNARKFAVFVNCILSGAATIGLAYSGCNSTAAIILTSIAVAMLGAQASGLLPCFVDMSPNYSSILLGICTTICVLPGTFSSYIVGVLTNNQQTSHQWKYVFLISASMSMISGMVYIIFGTAEEQPWNKSSKPIEMKSLNVIRKECKN